MGSELKVSPEQPFYRAWPHDESKATILYYITCDEGWRLHIVCERMYKWAADWLVEVLQGKPYADKKAP